MEIGASGDLDYTRQAAWSYFSTYHNQKYPDFIITSKLL